MTLSTSTSPQHSIYVNLSTALYIYVNLSTALYLRQPLHSTLSTSTKTKSETGVEIRVECYSSEKKKQVTIDEQEEPDEQ